MDRNQKYDDETLLQKFYLSRDNFWLGILLQRYTLLLLGVCMKYLGNEEAAKDAVQQIFYKVLIEIEHHHIHFFKGWIYTVAKNHCLMQLRSNKYIHLEELNEELEIKGEDIQALSTIEKERIFNFLEEGLLELKEEQRSCISLFYLQKKSYSEIVGITGYTTTQVKSYIQNGKNNLRNSIDKKRKQDE